MKIALTNSEQTILRQVKAAAVPIGIPELCQQLHLTPDEVYHAVVFLVAARLLHPSEGPNQKLLLHAT